jgi:predicted Zn-dependent protease with MMP-like domain
VNGLFRSVRAARTRCVCQKLYSAVAFGSPLLTSAEYQINLSRPFTEFKGNARISRKMTGRSWRQTVAARLGDARRFESLVRDAIDALPDQFRRRLENVEIVIEDAPDRESLLGYYHGVPLTERGAGYSGYLPDKITIYRKPLEGRASTPEELAEQIRITVWHEIAHHFGIDDDRLRELGMG